MTITVTMTMTVTVTVTVTMTVIVTVCKSRNQRHVRSLPVSNATKKSAPFLAFTPHLRIGSHSGVGPTYSTPANPLRTHRCCMPYSCVYQCVSATLFRACKCKNMDSCGGVVFLWVCYIYIYIYIYVCINTCMYVYVYADGMV